MIRTLSGIASILWDVVKWCVSHPFHVGCIVFALAAWHYRGDGIKAREDAGVRIAALEAQAEGQKARADTEAANAKAAEQANATMSRSLDEAVAIAAANVKARSDAEQRAREAAAQARSLRQTIARLTSEAQDARAAIYSADSGALAWSLTEVPHPIAERLRAESAVLTAQ